MRQGDAFVKVANGEELDSVDSFRLLLVHQAMFREWEAYAYQHHIGVFDDSEWKAVLVNFRNVMQFPGTTEHWNLSKDMFSTLLGTTIEELLQSPEGAVSPTI